MNDDLIEEQAAPRRLRRRLPGNPASAVYGTIVSAGLIAGEATSHRSTAVVVLLMLGTLLVFWAAHTYADLLGGGVTDEPGKHHKWRSVLREEWPIVESGALPAVILVVAALFGASRESAALAALISAVAELCGWAALACRRMDLGWRHSVVYVLGAGGLGLAIIVLKVLLH